MKPCWLCENKIADLDEISNETILDLFRLCPKHETEIKGRKMSYQKGFTYPFKGKNGDAKGLPLADCSNEDLQFYLKTANPDDPQFGEKNKKMIAECQRIIQSRKSVPEAPQAPISGSRAVSPEVRELLALSRQTAAQVKVILEIVEAQLGPMRRESEEPPPSAKALFGKANIQPFNDEF